MIAARTAQLHLERNHPPVRPLDDEVAARDSTSAPSMAICNAVGGRSATLAASVMIDPVSGRSLMGAGASDWTPRAAGATIVYMSVEPLRAVRNHLSEIVDRVEHQHERVTITRNGRDAAVLISPDDLAQLEETLSVLSDPHALADIREADAAYARGDVIRGLDAVRDLAR